MSSPSVSVTQLGKVLHLLSSPHSQYLHERHLAALGQLSHAQGFAVADLPEALLVAQVVLGLAQTHAAFVPAAGDFIR